MEAAIATRGDFRYCCAVFTGLVEELGSLQSRTPRGAGARLHICTTLAPLVLGESIAVMGVCLTVDHITKDGFDADASAETLARTTLGKLPIGHRVHLERAMQLGGRLGGHVVSGHVDGVARLVERRPIGDAIALSFSFASSLAVFVAEKGSITVDGVSLTVNAVKADRFDVVVVPHTQGATLLGEMKPGSWANLEVDVFARYVARYLEVKREPERQGSSDDTLLSKLASRGYL